VISRGDIVWTDLGPIVGSAPGTMRPVIVVQSDKYNRSRLATAVVVGVTSNTQLSELPGNVFLPASASGLKRDSTINVSQISTVDLAALSEPVGAVPEYLMAEVSAGLRRILDLQT
jgi:mRNA interferase MazF